MHIHLPKTLPHFSQCTALVVGDVMLDRYFMGETRRVSPEAPVPIVNVEHVNHRPGGAGNVALGLAALGVHTRLLGITGKDEAAAILAQQFDIAAVKHDLYAIEQCSTIIKLRVVSQHQQLLRLDFEQCLAGRLSDENKTYFMTCYRKHLQQATVVILSDYQKGTLFDVPALIQLAREAGIPILVDPKGDDFSIYQYANILTPNYKEFESVVGVCRDEQMLIEQAQFLRRKYSIDTLLITCGESGMVLVQEEVMSLPACARGVFDVTGAGDTVIATLSALFAVGLGIKEATALANLAAGLVVSKLGAATVSVAELRALLGQPEECIKGILTEEQLLFVLNAKRALGQRIVFTNGCFDLLHAGHVAYLRTAKQFGDYLVVAVNTDESVRTLKGKLRPIHPLEQRLIMLAELSTVDWVIPFADKTPERLLHIIRPDVLVKGGDYQKDQVIGADIVYAYGGEVKIVSQCVQASSTAILKRICSQQVVLTGNERDE